MKRGKLIIHNIYKKKHNSLIIRLKRNLVLNSYYLQKNLSIKMYKLKNITIKKLY